MPETKLVKDQATEPVDSGEQALTAFLDGVADLTGMSYVAIVEEVLITEVGCNPPFIQIYVDEKPQRYTRNRHEFLPKVYWEMCMAKAEKKKEGVTDQEIWSSLLQLAQTEVNPVVQMILQHRAFAPPAFDDQSPSLN